MTPTECSLFGLKVRSELPLPGFPQGPPGEASVEVRFGPVAVGAAEWASVTPEGDLLLRIANVGRFRVSGGREIVIDPEPEASERNQRVFLLGSAFGALLHQRGLLPLHANAVEIGGRAFLFIGRSGAGKSTLAAWFHDRGHRVLADDVCAISLEGAQALAMPGVPRLRLWKDAVERSGRSSDAFERSFDGHDKFDVPTRVDPELRPLAVGACYILDRSDEAEGEPRLDQLMGLDALDALVANTYRGAFVPLTGASERHVKACLALMKSVPVFRAVRRWGSDAYEEEAIRLERHAARIAAAPA